MSTSKSRNRVMGEHTEEAANRQDDAKQQASDKSKEEGQSKTATAMERTGKTDRQVTSYLA